MRLLLLLVCITIALSEPLKLNSNVPHSGSLRGRNPQFFSFESKNDEEILIWVETSEAVSILVDREPYPAPWNATFSAVDHITIEPEFWRRNTVYFSLYPAVEFPEGGTDYTVTVTSAIPLRQNTPFTYHSSDKVVFSVPACLEGVKLKLELEAQSGNVDNIYWSQSNGRPTDADNTISVTSTTFETEITAELATPVFMTIDVSRSTGFTINVGSTEFQEVEDLEELTGTLSRGCFAHFRLPIEPNAGTYIAALASESWRLESTFFYVSFSDDNQFPDDTHYDDVSFLEKGGVLAIPTVHITGTHLYIGLAPTILQPRVTIEYSLRLSTQHHVMVPGFQTMMPVSNESLSSFVSAAEIPVRTIGVATQILLPPERLEGFTIYGSTTHVIPDEDNNQAVGDYSTRGIAFFEGFFWVGDYHHYYSSIDNVPEEFSGSSVPVLTQFIHRMTADSTYRMTIDSDKSIFFRLEIPSDHGGEDFHITTESESSSPIEIFADLDFQMPSSLSWTHRYTGSSTQPRVKELVIPGDDIGDRRYVYVGLRGLSTSRFSVRAITRRVTPITSGQRLVQWIEPENKQRYLFNTVQGNCAGAQLIVHLESEAKINCYVSQFWSNPDEHSADHTITPGNTFLSNVDGSSVSDGDSTWFFSVAHLGTSNATPDLFELYVSLVFPLVNGQYQWNDLTASVSEHVYLFSSDGQDSDHWLEIQVYSPSQRDNSSLVSVYVSSVGLPSASQYDYKLDLSGADTEAAYIEMLHDESGSISGSFLVSVNGYSRRSFYILSLMSSVHIHDSVPITSSVMLNENKFFNYRITDPIIERMISLDAEIVPVSDEYKDCLEGISLYASARHHHPSDWNKQHGGKGVHKFTIGEDDLGTGRMYFAVEGTSKACPFTLKTSAIFNCEPETTCNGNGECNTDGSCSCYSDSKNGFWDGDNCDVCEPLYKGDDCLTPICSSEWLCNGNGVCDDDDCQCFQDEDRGFYAGTRCNVCMEGYYGPECLLEVGYPIYFWSLFLGITLTVGFFTHKVYNYIKTTTSGSISNPASLSDLEHALLKSSVNEEGLLAQ
ncbi:hypothetical protein P9112_004668 [Eukaryota sp. TZLM1-RC]